MQRGRGKPRALARPLAIKVSLRSLYAMRHARDFRYQAGPSSFLRVTLKTWEWPGDEASRISRQTHKCKISIMMVSIERLNHSEKKKL